MTAVQIRRSAPPAGRDLREGWRDDAACRGADPELFHPPVNTARHPAAHHVKDAEPYCRRCPVLAPCRQEGIEGRDHGIWGGLLQPGDHDIWEILRRHRAQQAAALDKSRAAIARRSAQRAAERAAKAAASGLEAAG